MSLLKPTEREERQKEKLSIGKKGGRQERQKNEGDHRVLQLHVQPRVGLATHMVTNECRHQAHTGYQKR